MGKKKNISIFLIFIIVAAAIGLFAFIKGNVGSVTSIESGVGFVNFGHGNYHCEEIGQIQKSVLKSITTQSFDIKCQSTFGITSTGCEVNLQALSDYYFDRKVYYQICNIQTSSTDYTKNLYTSTDYVNCSVASDVAVDDLPLVVGHDGSLFSKHKAGSASTLRAHLSSNEVIRISKIQSTQIGVAPDTNLWAVYVTYQPYGIVRHDPFNGGTYNIKTTNCMPPTNIPTYSLVIQSSDAQEFKDLFTGKNFMYATEYIDFISTPYSTVFSEQRLKKINGVYGYCQPSVSASNNAYYAVEQLTTSNSIKYYYLDLTNSLKSNVLCCEGDVGVGVHCVNETWVSDSVCQTCNNQLNPCPIQHETRYGDKQVYRQQCSSAGCCENSIRPVDCTQNSDCLAKQGGICTADWSCLYPTYTCTQNGECLGGQTCTNGACTSPQSLAWVWWVVGGMFVLAVLLVVVLVKRDGRTQF